MNKILFFVILSVLLADCSQVDSDECRHEWSFDWGDDMPPSDFEKYNILQRYQLFKAWVRSGDPLFASDSEIDISDVGSLIPPYLKIRDIFTYQEVDNIYDPANPADVQKFALYVVYQWSCPRFMHFVIYYQGEFTVIYMGNYLQAVKSLLSYFKNHPQIDERLQPLCMQELTKLYVSERLGNDEAGPWRHWLDEEADSLGLIYNQLLQYR